MKSKICCWRVVSFSSAIRTVLSPVRPCVRTSKGAIGRHQGGLHEKGRRSGFFRMRPRGFEPPPRNCRTRPSTWRVYQFRHRRERKRESSHASRGADGAFPSTLGGAGQAVAGVERKPRSRKVRTPKGKGGRGNSTRGNPRESGTEKN